MYNVAKYAVFSLLSNYLILKRKRESLLMKIDKLFETNMYDQIYAYIDNYLSPFLCGFRKGFITQHCRIPLIESFQAVYDFDIFGACESSLTDLISNNEISIHGFSPEPIRSNKPQNAHSGGVCLYYKPNLSIKQRKDLEIISEPVVAELTLKRIKVFFVLSYRHPNQTLDDVENYMVAISDIYEQI